MGLETAALVALGTSALGAGANYYNTRQTEKRQDNELANQIRQRAQLQGEADTAVNRLLASRAASDGTGERVATANQYLDQVRQAQGAATAGLRQGGAVSDAYRQSANDAALGIGDYGATAANLMARIDAPNQVRQRESIENAQLGSDLGRVARRSAGQDYIGQMRLQGIRRNPWLDAFSQLASGASSAIAGSSFGGDQTAALSGQANAITGANNADIFNRAQQRWSY